MANVFVSGSFDLFHVGHLNIINRARELCGDGGLLVVGVHSDESVYERKLRRCVIPFEQRVQIVRALKGVDVVVRLESIPHIVDYLAEYEIDTLVTGDDYAGDKWKWLGDHCRRMVCLPRTPGVSTTEIIDRIQKTPVEL